MAVKFRAVTTVTNVDGADASTLTISKPTGTAPGDVLILVTGQYTGDAGMAGMTSQGFVLLDILDEGTSLRTRAYKKIAGASEPATYTVNFAGSTGAVNASLAAFSGAHDVLTWSNTLTGSEADAAFGYDLDAARDSVAYQVFTWRSDTANATVVWSGGTEKFDVTAKNSASIRRGQSGVYYGPEDVADIVHAGGTFASLSADLSPAASPIIAGAMWNFLIADKVPEPEQWDDTDGSKAVEVKMDRVELDATGSISTRMALDITTLVSAFTASAQTEAASQAADGLASTNWRDSATAAPQFLTYDFGASYSPKAKRYRIQSAASGSVGSTAMDPMDWTVEGSANGSSWTVLDTRTNESFGNRGDVREFRITDPGAYRYYKLNVSKNFSSGSTVGSQLAEFRLSTVDVWEDITEYVNYEDKIRITRGLQGTSGRSDYSRAYFTVDNTDGRFSLRNPNGAYHGGIKRNSECRISKAYGDTGLQMQGAVQVAGTDIIGDCFRTPLTSPMQITSGLDLRMELELEAWHDLQSLAACGPDIDDPETGWAFTLDADAKLHFGFIDTTAVFYEAVSTVSVPEVNRQSLKVTYDGSTGATTFYTASTFNGTWVQLGEVVTIDTAANNIDYNGGSLCIGQTGAGSPHGPHGTVYQFELRDTVLATTVADLDFTAIPNGSRSYTDSAGQLWIAVNYAVVSNRRYRFHGEISSWPTAWDPTGTWVYVPITASGVQKRLERGSSVGSVMYRHHTRGIVSDPKFGNTHAAPIGYWPMEDLKESFQCASAITGKPHLEIYGTPLFEEFDNFNESSPLPDLNGTKFGARVTGAGTDYIEARFLLDTTDTTPAVGGFFITLWGNGTYPKFQIYHDTTNEWRYQFLTEAGLESGTAAVTSAVVPVTDSDQRMHVKIIMEQVGADISVTVDVRNTAGEDLGGNTQTFSSQTFGRIYRVQINDAPVARLTEIGMGHLALYGSATTSPDWTAPVNAHHYETAADRVKRIADEEGIQFRLIGDRGSSAFMGYQAPQSAQDIMSSAAVSDSGYLVDPLDAFGVEYRTDRSIFSRPARLTLSYTGNELSNELLPVDDDSHIVNDFTATRGEAGSSRFVLTEGELSIQAPPHGVGPYSAQQSYSLAHEGQCVDIASWNVHQGTLNEERYPRIEVALENARISASPSLTLAILTTDVGQRVDITDTPDFLPAQDIRQIVIGYEEWFDQFQHQVKFNTISERAFEIAGYNDGSRFATNSAELYQDISSSATSILVETTSGPRWSTDPAAIPIDWDVDGELMRVTAVGRLISSNPFFDDNVTGWSVGTGTSVARSTAYVHYYDQAVASLALTPNGVGTFADAVNANSAVASVTALEQYEASAWVYSPAGTGSVSVGVFWRTSGGVFISTSGGTDQTIPAGTWTHISEMFQAPATASIAQMRVRVGGTPASGNITYWYSARLVEKSYDAAGTFDSFNRANSLVTLGSTDDNLVQAWTEVGGGDWGIQTNRAYTPVAGTFYAVVSGHADFELLEMTIPVWTAGSAFIVFRFLDVDNRARWGGTFGAAPDIVWRVGGVNVRTETASGYTLAAGDKLGVRCRGSVVEVFQNDILILTATESSLINETTVGMLSTSTNPRIDNFTYKPGNYPQTATVVRGVNGITAHHPAGTPVELNQRPYRGL